MSAIFGIINKNGKPVEQDRILKIQQALIHQTTDGNGLWQNENAAFGFCKLITYSTQINERLPVEEGDFVLTADARIYNRDQLCNLLALDKKQWQNEPDSYLILRAYQKWDVKCVNYLEGEYVFALWNKISRDFFMATDHIGLRQVFYYDGPEEFVFCSEVKGVVAAKNSPNYFNEKHIINYHFRQSLTNQTYNKDVFALGGANTLTLKKSKLVIEKFWQPTQGGKYHFNKDSEWFDCLREILFKAVEKRLNLDAAVGVTLSGGLDSSSIACILAQVLAKKNKPLFAFSSVMPTDYKGPEKDERKFIKIINRHCSNIVQTYVEAPGAGPLFNVEDAFNKSEGLPNAFFYMDEALLEAAKAKDVRNMFSGFGGDLFISWNGNTAIYQLMQQRNFLKAWQSLSKVAKTENTNLFQLLKQEYLAHTKAYGLLRGFVRRNQNPWQFSTALKDGFVQKYQSLLGYPVDKNPKDFLIRYIKTGRISRTIGSMAIAGSYYNMASSIPFFDKDMLEFFMDAPFHLHLNNGWKRSMIRCAMEGIIPHEIQWRRDKLPYSPDYKRRITASRPIFEQLMLSPQCDFVFERYVEKGLIKEYFTDGKPPVNRNNQTINFDIQIAQAGICLKVLTYLKKTGYLFE